MLAALGVDRAEELFAAVPREMLVDRLNLPQIMVWYSKMDWRMPWLISA